MKNRRSSLRVRILAAFLLSFAAFLGAVGYPLVQLRALGDGLAVIKGGYLPLSRVATQLESLQARIDVDTNFLSGPRGPLPVLDLRESSTENGRRIELLLDEASLTVADAQKLTREPEEIAVLTSLDRQLDLIAEAHIEHESVTGSYLGLLEVGAGERAELMEPELAEVRSQLQAEIAQLGDRVDDSILRVSTRTSAAQNRALAASAALSAAALAFGLVMLGLAVLSLRPIGRMTREVQRIARGEYSARIEVGRRDELGVLAEEVNAMARSIEQRDEALRAQALQQLKDRERLARSERLALVGQMLAQITHEVRNPLNAMGLNAELLDEELEHLPAPNQIEAREMLETITSELTRLEAVTEHYLSLARRPQPSIEPTDLVELVMEVSRLLDEELRRAGVSLTCELGGEADLSAVPVDGNQLRQSLLNVVRNASEAGAQHIAVSLWRDEGQVHLAVDDDGPGMDAETAERALDPFYSTKATGTGLGLAITRQILEDHGGSIHLERRASGTRVLLTLPA